MTPEEEKKVLKGRKAVDKYRKLHFELHQGDWHPGIPEAHTPLLNQLKTKLKKLGFASLDDFFEQSKKANYEILRSYYVLTGECDWCVGRKRPVECIKTGHSPNIPCTEETRWRMVRFFGGTLSSKGCSIYLDEIKTPPLDWLWR